jgi:pimeloyl-ACP methyl ester carboxylesterase
LEDIVLFRLLKRCALGILAFVVGGTIAGFAYRAYWQHEAAEALLISTANGIDERRFIQINGIEHWITIRGLDRNHPIIVFVHGGPAEIVSFMPSSTQAWESEFTVVHWDQRGAGHTYGRNAQPPIDLTLARMTDDGVEVVRWLTGYLGQPKVILVGHSWGSILGLHMVLARPDLFAAYVGTGQFVSWASQVEEQYAYSLDRARSDRDSRVLSALTELGAPPSSDMEAYQAFRALTRHHLAQADLDFASRQLTDLLLAPRVSLVGILHALRGARASVTALAPTLLSADIRNLGNEVPVPFIVVQGDSDRITPTSLTVDYFNGIEAPGKVLVLIEDAGHYAFVTHAEQFLEALVSSALPLARSASSP